MDALLFLVALTGSLLSVDTSASQGKSDYSSRQFVKYKGWGKNVQYTNFVNLVICVCHTQTMATARQFVSNSKKNQVTLNVVEKFQ